MLYSNLFECLISQINQSLGKKYVDIPDENTLYIGIVDIFGFENFQKNGFEQFWYDFFSK